MMQEKNFSLSRLTCENWTRTGRKLQLSLKPWTPYMGTRQCASGQAPNAMQTMKGLPLPPVSAKHPHWNGAWESGSDLKFRRREPIPRHFWPRLMKQSRSGSLSHYHKRIPPVRLLSCSYSHVTSATSAWTLPSLAPSFGRISAIRVWNGMQETLLSCSWYGDHVSAQGEQRLQHEQAKAQMPELEPIHTTETETHEALAEGPGASLPEGISLVESEPITDRKSVFVGRACAITDPAQVPDIIAYLMSDRKISRAAHPVIYAWRFEINGTVHQDNDDNGETAAGGRLAHLLQIMGLTHVLVVVTRYFGGIHLGPDRFKHINAAARSAIELAGLLDDHTKKPKGGKRK